MVTPFGDGRELDPVAEARSRAAYTARTQRILDDVAVLAEWCRARGRTVVIHKESFDKSVRLRGAVVPQALGPWRADAVSHVLADPTMRVLVTAITYGGEHRTEVSRHPHPEAIWALVSKSPLSGNYAGVRVSGAEEFMIRDGVIVEELGIAATVSFDNRTSLRVVETNSGFEVHGTGARQSYPFGSLAGAIAYIGEGESAIAIAGTSRPDGRDPRITSVECPGLAREELARLLRLDHVPPLLNGTRWTFPEPPSS